ncbi:MAG: Gfo/Idh/MocA family protein [Anaerolineae bacterium]
MMRVGLVGLGFIGRAHATSYAKIDDARIVAVADLMADEMREDSDLQTIVSPTGEQAAWYADYRDMFASEDLDSVDICLPTYRHAETSMAALEAGLPVLCEKPMALSLEDCDAMIEASERAGKPLMIAQCLRFWHEYELIRAKADPSGYGRILSMQLWRGSATPTAQAWMREAARSGGAILDLHIHDVDYVQHVLGLPKRVYAQGGQSLGAERGYDYVLASYEYGPGVQVSAAAHWVDVPLPFAYRAHVRYERAYLQLDSGLSPSLRIYIDEGEERIPAFEGDDAYTSEIRYFLDIVRTGGQPDRCTPLEARNSVGLVMAEIASIQRGQPVEVSEFTRPA